MKDEYVCVERLFPAQWGVRRTSLSLLINSFDPGEFKPIPVIERSGKLILGGGHNRAFFVDLIGSAYGVKPKVRVRIVENEEELMRFFEGGFGTCINDFFRHYDSVSGSNWSGEKFPDRISDLRYECTLQNRSKRVKLHDKEVYAGISTDLEYLGTLPNLDLLRSQFGLS